MVASPEPRRRGGPHGPLRSLALLVQPAPLVRPISFALADLTPKTCAYCGRTFTPSSTRQNYCNLRCASGGSVHAS